MVDFNPYAESFSEDPYPTYKQLRDEAPAFYNPDLKFWALSRYADVLNAHRDPNTFSSAGGVSIEGNEAGMPLLLVTDAPKHRWQKGLVTRVFTPSRMAALEPFIRTLVNRLLDSAAHKDEIDFVAEFALQVPLQVISELIGIPEEYRQEIHNLTNTMIDRSVHLPPEEMYAAQMRTLQIYGILIDERRRVPREDPITHLIQSEFPDENGTMRCLTDEELAWRFSEIASAGHETVAKAIPNGAIAFQRFPAERAKLRDNTSLLLNTVDEILRFDPPSQLQGRTTTSDVTLHGVTIPSGSKTMLLTGAATRDERKFDSPDVFDITRQPGNDSLYFGNGVHKCLGIHLARLELSVVFEEIFRRFPDFEVDPVRATRTVLSNVRGVATLPARLGAAR